mgnify:CR=1 FL=1
MERVIRTFITAGGIGERGIWTFPQRPPTAPKERRQGHGCHPVPIRPTQGLTGPNGGGIVGGSMTEGKWLLLCQRHSKIQQAAESIAGQRPVSSLCPSAFGPQKVGVGASPQKAFGCLWQAKRSACPTRGWVKPRSPAVQVLAAQALSALRGDVVWFFPHFFRPSISPSSAGQIAPGLWHKPVADGNQGNGPAPGTRPPHAPVPLRRGYGAILSPGRHTGAHRGK